MIYGFKDDRTKLDLDEFKQGIAEDYNQAIADAIQAIGTPVVYRGSVEDYAHLPSNAEAGDMYNVADTNDNYVWSGTVWDQIGMMIDLSSIYTKSEADAKFALITDLPEELGPVDQTNLASDIRKFKIVEISDNGDHELEILDHRTIWPWQGEPAGYGSYIFNAHTCTKPAYELAALNTSPDLNGTSYPVNPNMSYTSIWVNTLDDYQIFYPELTRIAYKRIFKANGGTGDDVLSLMSITSRPYQFTLCDGDIFDPPEGFEFDSWNSKADGSGNRFEALDSFITEEDATFYAIWTEVSNG